MYSSPDALLLSVNARNTHQIKQFIFRKHGCVEKDIFQFQLANSKKNLP